MAKILITASLAFLLASACTQSPARNDMSLNIYPGIAPDLIF